jgi:hypothetical protein
VSRKALVGAALLVLAGCDLLEPKPKLTDLQKEQNQVASA